MNIDWETLREEAIWETYRWQINIKMNLKETVCEGVG
jgi:hypothetical protein